MEEGTSLWKDAWIRLRKNRLALLGGVLLAFMVVISLVTPWIAPYEYDEQDLKLMAEGPSADHLLGTDTLGRDLLTRIMYGGRISLMVGFVATAVSLLIGVLWGTVAGYLGGRTDSIMMRIVDILYALPFIIFVVLLMVVFGRNLVLLFLAIGAQTGIHRRRCGDGAVALADHSCASDPERPGTDHRLHHADHPQCDAA